MLWCGIKKSVFIDLSSKNIVYKNYGACCTVHPKKTYCNNKIKFLTIIKI